jgi:putative ATP-binding cassette transporter
MTGNIFLNYRREDAGGFAHAVFTVLERSFPPESIFMDVAGGIVAGQNFARVIDEKVRHCDVMLVLIGSNWLTATDETGGRRLDSAQDYVRIEIELALRFGKHVIPVLLPKAEMPREDLLPQPLRALVRKNAVQLTNDRFRANAQELAKAVEGALAEAEERRREAAARAAQIRPFVPERSSLLYDIIWMASGFWASRQRNKLVMLASALIAVVGATAYLQFRLNSWNRPFYDALTNKDMLGFLSQLFVFGELAGVMLVLNVAQMWLNETSKVSTRQSLVDDLLDEWLKPQRAFRLSNSGDIGANPDHRIQADAQHLTDLSTDLGIGLLQSTLLLLTFVGVLWAFSQGQFLPFGGQHFSPPGYLVWCALVYAGAASLVSWRVGRPLFNQNAERYGREADFRFALERINQHIDGITLYGGEADERESLNGVFGSVLSILRRIVASVTRLTWVTAGYGWFAVIAPILVVAPAYFQSKLSFGELMVIVGAFNQVQTALRWFVDNFSNLADWRATLLRVATFRNAIMGMDDLGQATRRIDFAETDDTSITIDDLHVDSPVGCVKLSEPHANMNPHERILIVGEKGEEQALLFRAIGGLWPWGSGRIARPAAHSIMFMPVRAYIPPGTLREAVAYPHPAHVYGPPAIVEALAAVGLEHLEPRLDEVSRWDRELTVEQRQLLAFARVFLQRPRWIVTNDPLDALEPYSRQRIRTLFSNELADIGLINIGHDLPDIGLYSRKLHLVMDPSGQKFEPQREQGFPEPPKSPGESLSAK